MQISIVPSSSVVNWSSWQFDESSILDLNGVTILLALGLKTVFLILLAFPKDQLQVVVNLFNVGVEHFLELKHRQVLFELRYNNVMGHLNWKNP